MTSAPSLLCTRAIVGNAPDRSTPPGKHSHAELEGERGEQQCIMSLPSSDAYWNHPWSLLHGVIRKQEQGEKKKHPKKRKDLG